jgi:signal transduction histidine kinase/ligand-binding sensor domain-containing protein/DNA-binding response OmpR family regulator
MLILVSCTPIREEKTTNNEAESPLINNTISNQQVKAFAEDSQGHIWIGTFRGLNKSVTHEYHQYFCADDTTSLPDNQIQSIYLDSKKRLWISTVNGICTYTDQDNFQRIPLKSKNKNVVQIVENHQGRIFLNTIDKLYAQNPATQQFDCVIPNTDPFKTLNVTCHIDDKDNLWVVNPLSILCYDSSSLELKDSIPVTGYPNYSFINTKNEIWLTGNHSLSIFDTHSSSFKNIPQIIKEHKLLSRANIEYIHPYDSNGLLLCTSANGIFYYNYEEEKIIHQDDTDFPFEVPKFKISCIFTDTQKNLWFGSVDQGINVSYHYKVRFKKNNNLRSHLQNKSVISVACDKDQNLWIATLLNGVYIYNTQAQQIRSIETTKLFTKPAATAFHVNQIFIDDTNAIWMSATNNEVVKCRYSTNNSLEVESRHSIFLPMSITQDNKKTIWIGTATQYVHALKKGTGEFIPLQIFETNFTFIPSLLPLRNGKLLVGAFNKPLKIIDYHNNYNVKEAEISDEEFKSCIQRSVFIPTAVHEDEYGNIWIGTVSNGLICYSPSDGKIRPIPGASCLDISGIEEDKEGNIWISTQYGLNKLDRISGQYTSYFETEGIGGNQFYDRSSCQLADGTLVFGGTHGLTIFNPQDVQIKRHIPVIFENLKIHNRLVQPQKDNCIDRHLSYNPDITLKHDQNSFNISFAALDYSEFERVHYHYKMDGFDNYWVDARNNHEAYYANLPSGEYTFRVSISNKDNSNIIGENSIRIVVKPAPWHSWWACSIYLMAATTLIWIFVNSIRRIRKEKALAQQAEQDKLQEQRMNKMNMSFFANISHEFRTPLTMISGPIAQLIDNPSIEGNNKELLMIIGRSVNRMLKLVNQLMDFNKLENDTLKLNVKRTDIISFLKRQLDLLLLNAKSKGITVNTTGMEETFILWLDEDKMEQIINNLISNAMKHTPINGKISISFDLISRQEANAIIPLTETDIDSQYIKISLSNSGPSIPEDKLEKIFERYYQIVGQKEGTYNWGTGIGLYYARSLAKLHHGHLIANNINETEGVTFTLIVPANDVAYSIEERVQDELLQTKAFPIKWDEPVNDFDKEDDDSQKHTILVIDDDMEVIHYLKTLLSPKYRIICRFDADSALSTIQEESPDIILSDVVMPGKNGTELCREIKEDPQFCHIPIILVTAQTTIQNQVEGLNTGANAYVTKPFDPNYLLALIKSQLLNRENAQSLLGKSTHTNRIGENVLLPQDKNFMNQLYQLMESELSNHELDITMVTNRLKISRTKLYYKVKGLTGENPSVFFKTFKLNRAKELIIEGRYNISEIADMTGFSSLSHFSTSFKKKFGIAPSDFKP